MAGVHTDIKCIAQIHTGTHWAPRGHCIEQTLQLSSGWYKCSPSRTKTNVPPLCSYSLSNSMNGAGDLPESESSGVNGSAGHRDNHYIHYDSTVPSSKSLMPMLLEQNAHAGGMAELCGPDTQLRQMSSHGGALSLYWQNSKTWRQILVFYTSSFLFLDVLVDRSVAILPTPLSVRIRSVWHFCLDRNIKKNLLDNVLCRHYN